MTCPENRPACFLSAVASLALLLLIVLLPSLSVRNQAYAAQKHDRSKDSYALIFGTVWGPDNLPVYGVKVKIRRAQDKKPKWELYSDHRGEFAQRVPPGKSDYVVWAETKGLKTSDGKPLHLVQEAPVHVEYDERVDIGLHLSN